MNAPSAYEADLAERVLSVVDDACTAQDDGNGARAYFLDGPSTPQGLAAKLVELVAAPLADMRNRHGALADVLGVSRDTAPYLLIRKVEELRAVDGDALADLVKNLLPSRWRDKACDEFAERLLGDLHATGTVIRRGPDSLPWTPRGMS